ncbi:MAG: hypothetical protein Q9199_007229 [Rusavskia elegans]
MTDKALDNIAAELGVPVNDLEDSLEFVNPGVDSLMSLSITGCIREELEIGVQSSLFSDYPTVRGMKELLRQYDLSELVEEKLEETGADLTSDLDCSDAISFNDGSMSTPTSTDSASKKANDDWDSLSMIVRETISREMCVKISELLATDDLAALGLDSLMTLTIFGALCETMGLSLPASFLMENNSIQVIEELLHITPRKKDAKLKANTQTAKPQGHRKQRRRSGLQPLCYSKWIRNIFYVHSSDLTRHGHLGPQFTIPEDAVRIPGGVVGKASKLVTEIKRRQHRRLVSRGSYGIRNYPTNDRRKQSYRRTRPA